jgi:hypothetical protein
MRPWDHRAHVYTGVVDVLLLYNTFRMLGPAFDGRSAQDDNESFGTPEGGNSPTMMSAQLDPLTEKFGWDHRIPTSRPSSPGSSLQSSQTAIRFPVPAHHQPVAQKQSFYSYPAQLPIDRAIIPVADLNQTIASSELSPWKTSPAAAQVLNEHTRQSSVASTDSLRLPAPPRRSRSPVLRYPSVKSVDSPVVRNPNSRWSPAYPQLSLQTSMATHGRSGSATTHDSSYSTSTMNDSRALLSPSGSARSGPYARPLLSAVNSDSPGLPKQPSATRRRSLSAVVMTERASVSRQNVVFRSHSGSTGSTL